MIMKHDFQTTIAAISTGMTPSGIGIVRMTGPDSFAIADRVYRGKENKRLCEQQSHTIHYGHIVERQPEDEGTEQILDEVLVMLMRGPHSYTGEDTVEINCHGGIYVVKRILELLLANGAKPAQPGEFTKRAFLNGRLDLSQAEAVGDLIASKNEYALKSSVSQLKGSIKEKMQEIRSQILYHTAFIETALDDPEHISVDGYGETLDGIVVELLSSLDHLLSTYEDGRMIREGIQTVIIGKPNAGKSSILNLLLREDRAIVTDIAGTTRDVLTEQLNLQGVTLNIVDTAGIRDTEDVVEKIGVEKSREAAKDADLVLFVMDASTDLDENDREIISFLLDKKVIVLLNKSDLCTVITREDVETAFFRAECDGKSEEFRENQEQCIEKDAFWLENQEIIEETDTDRTEKEEINESNLAKFNIDGPHVLSADQMGKKGNNISEKYRETLGIIETSAVSEQGIRELEETIKTLFFEGNLSFNDEIYITNARQKAALADARDSLQKVRESIRMGLPEDFYSIDLMDAYESLGKITGEAMGEDLVNEIFSKFCMGK